MGLFMDTVAFLAGDFTRDLRGNESIKQPTHSRSGVA
jgi:hypothetical protein